MRAGSTLKVLFAATRLGKGGAERSLTEWLPAMEARGVQCIVTCALHSPDGFEPEVLRRGIDVRFLPGPGLRQRVVALRQLIRSERPDLVHAALRTTSLAAGLATVGTGVPVLQSHVNRLYDPAVGRSPEISGARHWLRRRIDAWVTRRLATHVHAVSRTVERYAIEFLGVPPERITVVERGRDPERLGAPSEARRQAARARLGLAPEDQVLVNVANHKWGKGQDDLLEAVALLRPGYPHLRLLMVGRTGTTTSLIENTTIRLGLSDVATFMGFRHDIPEILAAADVFVFPSFAEGLPGALVEASALGLPIAASDIGPVNEVAEAGHNALLFPPRSPEAMADAVGALLSDPQQRERFGRRSRQIYEERFTLEPTVDRMLDLFTRVVAMGRSRIETRPTETTRAG